MSSKPFNITLPLELVQTIDRIAKQQYASRSDYIRSALVRQLKDDAEWDAFFTKSHTKGRALGLSSEEQVYEMIDSLKKEKIKAKNASGRY